MNDSTLSSSDTSRTSERLVEFLNWFLLPSLVEGLIESCCCTIFGSLPSSRSPLSDEDWLERGESLLPVAGLLKSSSGSGSSLKELGGRAT